MGVPRLAVVMDMRTETVKGTTVSPGVGLGRGCFARSEKQKQTVTTQPTDLSGITETIHHSFRQLKQHLDNLIQYAEDNDDSDAAALFKAHKMISDELRPEVLKTLEVEETSAAEAITKNFDAYTQYFSELTDNYMRQKASDFTELKTLLLDFLNNRETLMSCREYVGCRSGECALQNEHILITDELTASIALRISAWTKGIITDKCNPSSHAAVIARSLGIPVISGIKHPRERFSHHDNILIDGAKGEIVINPDEVTLKRYRGRINTPDIHYDVVDPVPGFRVLADIDLYRDVQKAEMVKADGIGLYRTEFELLSAGHALNEREQVEHYRYIIERMAGKPVYIRVLDLGSDKSAPWMDFDEELNPALGCRGARLLLAKPELLKVQARALALASQGSAINVIYPMIATVNEFQQLKDLFIEATADIEDKAIRHGIMFEVPSACVNAKGLYEVIDFGRIGSNDLVQYLFAQDRTSDDYDYSTLVRDPAVWQLMTLLADAARQASKPLELCGMLVDMPDLIPKVIDLGITTVSTRPDNIAKVRKTVRACIETEPA